MTTISNLKDFSTCEISDALVKLGSPTGGLIPDIFQMTPPAKICGPAYTVKMVLASDTIAPRLDSHFVDTAPPESVIVIDAPSQAKNAVWGGLMSAGAQVKSALGVVISGNCRDLAEHRALGFPVFARSHSTLGQSPFTRPSAINVPLDISPHGQVGDVFPSTTVHPGDWIVADEDGVVCIPRSLEKKVLELAAAGRIVDEKCMEAIRAGEGVQDTFKKYRGK